MPSDGIQEMKSRDLLPYRNEEERFFCVNELAKRYKFSTPYDRVIGKDWALYMFKEHTLNKEVWVLAIDLPERCVSFSMPFQIQTELSMQTNKGIILTLSGKMCNEDMFKYCMKTILESVVLE